MDNRLLEAKHGLGNGEQKVLGFFLHSKDMLAGTIVTFQQRAKLRSDQSPLSFLRSECPRVDRGYKVAQVLVKPV